VVEQDTQVVPSERGIDVLDLLLVLARNKRKLLGIPFLVALITAAASLTMDNVFTGTARLLPPQQSNSGSLAMLAQLSGASAILGSATGARNADLYAGMLKGHTIADKLIERFKLQERFGKKTILDTRSTLTSRTQITAGRDSIISVSFDDTDPKFAADVANAYVEELQELVQGLAITEASQRRAFFEQQLKKARVELANAEGALRQTQETTGLIQLDHQGRAIIEAIARLRAEIASKEVQIVASKSFATDSNPELIVLRQQLAGLRSELSKLERSGINGGGDVFIPSGKVPEAGLEYVRKLRDLKYGETIFELMAKQYEVAKLDEAKDMALIQFLDRAVPPDRKTKPFRSLIVLAMAFIAGVIMLLWVLVREAMARARRDPGTEEKLLALRRLVTKF
jgi:tyrosine-protein kinase Etk/Wzc